MDLKRLWPIAVLFAGLSAGVGGFAISQTDAENPAMPTPRPVETATFGPPGAEEPANIVVPRAKDPAARTTRYGGFRLVPDTLLDRATLPHQSIQAVPDGVTTSVIDPLTIQASSLLRTPA